MLEQELIDPIAKIIAQALLVGFVVGDRVKFQISERWEPRFGTVIGLNIKKSGFMELIVTFDDETRPDMMRQICLPSSLVRINE